MVKKLLNLKLQLLFISNFRFSSFFNH